MKRRDATDFLEEVLDVVEDIPDAFSEQIADLLKAEPRRRWESIRDLIQEATRE